MNIKNLVSKYNKEGLYEELTKMYPKCDNFVFYQIFINALEEISETEKDEQWPDRDNALLCMDLCIKNGNESYDVYVLDNDKTYAIGEDISLEECVFIEIDPEVNDILSEKEIIIYFMIESITSDEEEDDDYIYIDMDGDSDSLSMSDVLFSMLKYFDKKFHNEFTLTSLGSILFNTNEIVIKSNNDESILKNIKKGKWNASITNDEEDDQYLELGIIYEDKAHKTIEDVLSTKYSKHTTVFCNMENTNIVIKENRKRASTKLNKETDEETYIDEVSIPLDKDYDHYDMYEYRNEKEKLIAVRIIFS